MRIEIEVDPDRLGSYTDSHLALFWHALQAGETPEAETVELVRQLGNEIIRRWLSTTEPFANGTDGTIQAAFRH